MFTFLRKIRQSLISSGSTGKYLIYALGEIVLVVIGILIALQINNWNQSRLERNKEELLLKEIHADFINNKEEFKNTVRYYDRVRQNYTTLIKSFPIEPRNFNVDSMSSLLYRTNTTLDADIFQGSITALINSSSFAIISNPELRTLLVQWIDLVSNYKEAEALLIEFTVDQFFPYLDEHIPIQYDVGIQDKRVDLSFLSSVKFENMIKRRNLLINNMIAISEIDDIHIINTIDRILELSARKEK
jgi:hypothetical protein